MVRPRAAAVATSSGRGEMVRRQATNKAFLRPTLSPALQRRKRRRASGALSSQHTSPPSTVLYLTLHAALTAQRVPQASRSRPHCRSPRLSFMPNPSIYNPTTGRISAHHRRNCSHKVRGVKPRPYISS